MANHKFDFYTDDPEITFDYLRENLHSSIVRWQGRAIGRSQYVQMIIVLDNVAAEKQFRKWLHKHGEMCDLKFKPFPEAERYFELDNVLFVAGEQ